MRIKAFHGEATVRFFALAESYGAVRIVDVENRRGAVRFGADFLFLIFIQCGSVR